jgi:hypothetical protein
MERFALLRQAITHRTKPPPPPSGSEFGGHVPVEHDVERTSDSKLPGALVLLVPVAGVAWVALGWLVYRLAT